MSIFFLGGRILCHPRRFSLRGKDISGGLAVAGGAPGGYPSGYDTGGGGWRYGGIGGCAVGAPGFQRGWGGFFGSAKTKDGRN